LPEPPLERSRRARIPPSEDEGRNERDGPGCHAEARCRRGREEPKRVRELSVQGEAERAGDAAHRTRNTGVFAEGAAHTDGVTEEIRSPFVRTEDEAQKGELRPQRRGGHQRRGAGFAAKSRHFLSGSEITNAPMALSCSV
jgi:hypothetical protein